MTLQSLAMDERLRCDGLMAIGMASATVFTIQKAEQNKRTDPPRSAKWFKMGKRTRKGILQDDSERAMIASERKAPPAAALDT